MTGASPIVEALTERKHSGAFDGIRLLAAWAVLFGHSYVLLGPSNNAWGEIAVYVFFAISGYLVTQSWMRDPDFSRFMRRRALRIIPALAVVIILSSLVLGPLTTDLPISQYFLRQETWTYLTKIFIYPIQYGLPGVFEHNPMPYVVNGSLWTLRLEFGLYVVIAIFGLAGALRWRIVSMALAAICLIGSLLMDLSLFTPTDYAHQINVLLNNAAPFFIGAVLAQSVINTQIIALALCLAIATLLSLSTPFAKQTLLLALPIVVIVIAKYGHCDLSRMGDFSYGFYLWAFPVQQTIVSFVPNITLPELVLSASVLTLIFAALSWHLIEKPALSLKPRKKRDLNLATS